MIGTGILVSSTWFGQGQGYRFHGYRDMFVIVHSVDTGGCLMSRMSGRGAPAWGGRHSHENSGCRAQTVVVDVTQPLARLELLVPVWPILAQPPALGHTASLSEDRRVSRE